MRYLWMLQAVISPNNHFGLPEWNDWTACLSVYLPSRLPARPLTIHSLSMTGEFHKALGRPDAKASEQVVCSREVALEEGLKGGGISQLDNFKIKLTLAGCSLNCLLYLYVWWHMQAVHVSTVCLSQTRCWERS
jgi:hypothetical protein